MTAFYNEFDKSAAAWLRELIAGGHIAPGVVDERSIEDISPDELAEYDQCHFFAGIGGWPLALKIAGWPDDEPVWTGSCPCQPYSAAGAGAGDDDPRNLWWAFRWHIKHQRPAIVFGEQVESKAGRAWYAGVRADLETLGFTVGGADLCAASTGQEAEGWFVYPGGDTRLEPTTVTAPHIRQRIWWVADAAGIEFQGKPPTGHECGDVKDRGLSGRVADTDEFINDRTGLGASNDGGQRKGPPSICGIFRSGRMGDAPCERGDRRQDTAGAAGRIGPETAGPSSRVVQPESKQMGLSGHRRRE